MGILDFLFKKKQKSSVDSISVEPDFSTDEIFVKKGFYRVMLNVNISDDLKNRIYPSYLKAHNSGDPRAEEKVLSEYLTASGWKWEEFDRWREIFRQKAAWPYMWKLYRGICEDPPKTPKSIKEALPFLNVLDMKMLLRDYNIKPKPSPKKRIDFEKALVDLITFDQLQSILLPKVETRFEIYKHVYERDKCKLLAHTISATIYSTRNHHQFEDIGNNFEFKAETVDGVCPIENEYAEKFNKREIKTLPPFFPGDRTSIIFPGHRWKS